MPPIKIMMNGMPGNMAVNIAQHILKNDAFELIPFSLTGPEITDKEHKINSISIKLIRPENREEIIPEIIKKEKYFISVDFSHPTAVNDNAVFYCKHKLPFVMGTTGGNRKELEKIVLASSIPAVIAPNMAKQIVGFQAMMEYASKNFPDLFKDYSLEIRESHQKGKADTSGTAKAMVKYFNDMGVHFSEKDIIMERDPEIQKKQLGVPDEYLNGHAWHTYTLISEDKTACFQFSHNINGRDIYSQGVPDAIIYLDKKIANKVKGKVYNMIDVLSSKN
ncbi:4-hydroxy-tetrahydrodipicolinate reductase [Candidatus Magnetomoraceae bacterium gMMP-15]